MPSKFERMRHDSLFFKGVIHNNSDLINDLNFPAELSYLCCTWTLSVCSLGGNTSAVWSQVLQERTNEPHIREARALSSICRQMQQAHCFCIWNIFYGLRTFIYLPVEKVQNNIMSAERVWRYWIWLLESEISSSMFTAGWKSVYSESPEYL